MTSNLTLLSPLSAQDCGNSVTAATIAGSVVGVIIGVFVGGVVIIVVIILIFVVLKRRGEDYGGNCFELSFTSSHSSHSEESPSQSNANIPQEEPTLSQSQPNSDRPHSESEQAGPTTQPSCQPQPHTDTSNNSMQTELNSDPVNVNQTERETQPGDYGTSVDRSSDHENESVGCIGVESQQRTMMV